MLIVRVSKCVSVIAAEMGCPSRIAALGQISHDTPGRAYYLAKQTEGKTRKEASKEAMRCLKRRISAAVYRQLRADAIR